jgi:predicted dithiol-disulfide oxidoreductase (DUF899 family)
METHKIVSSDEWVEARMQHLKQEKELTRLRDKLECAATRFAVGPGRHCV